MCIRDRFSTVTAFLDCLPTAANMARVEFLGEIHYYVKRVFAFDGLILLFGLMFLMAGRLVDDRKTRVKDLLMAAPVHKKAYVGGKLLGNLCYTLTMMFSLLGISICGYLLCLSLIHIEMCIRDRDETWDTKVPEWWNQGAPQMFWTIGYQEEVELTAFEEDMRNLLRPGLDDGSDPSLREGWI